MKSLAFLTLYLGLVWGQPVVELAAVDGTDRVELRMDGELQAILYGGPPWKVRLDLGDELVPHHVEAVSFDARDRVLGRAEQWLNLPRAEAEVELFLDAPGLGAASGGTGGGGSGGGLLEGTMARVSWKAVHHDEARSVTVVLDGEPLPTDDLDAVPLPPFDPGTVHVLSAEVTFPDETGARADLAFGGPYADQVTTELSSVPVQVERRRQLRRPEEAGDWLRHDGEPMEVMAVDEGEADLFAVVDFGSRFQRLGLVVEMAKRMGERDARLVRFPDREEPTYRVMGVGVGERLGKSSPLRSMGMRAGDRLHRVRPQLDARGDRLHLFRLSRGWGTEKGGSAWQVAFHRIEEQPDVPQKLADAVAAAGLWASGRSRPRAVILVLGPDAEDRSDLDPATVRRYLDRLGVPLSVLYVEVERPLHPEVEKAGSRRDRLAAARARWGDGVVDVAEVEDWIHFWDGLRSRLDRQRILWVRGRHLPEDVELTPGAPPWLTLLAQAAAEGGAP